MLVVQASTLNKTYFFIHFGRNMSDLRVWSLIHLECTVPWRYNPQLLRHLKCTQNVVTAWPGIWQHTTQIYPYVLSACVAKYQVTQLQHSVYTLDAAIVEGYIVTVQYTPSVSTIILFTYPHILHTGKKVRLQIRIDHKMFDIFTSRNVKKNL
jgi:hypothetical protein